MVFIDWFMKHLGYSNRSANESCLEGVKISCSLPLVGPTRRSVHGDWLEVQRDFGCKHAIIEMLGEAPVELTVKCFPNEVGSPLERGADRAVCGDKVA
jgi:hypothetical protein